MDNLTPDSFKCNFCSELPVEPYECDQCGKLICSQCKTDMDKSKKYICVFCKKNCVYKKNIFCQRIISNFKLDCKFQCGKKVSVNENLNHIYECDKKTYTCKINDCKFSGIKSDLYGHLIEKHGEKLTFLAENFSFLKPYFLVSALPLKVEEKKTIVVHRPQVEEDADVDIGFGDLFG